MAKGAAMGGITPLEYLLSVMRNENATDAARTDAAKAAAPYVHPKLATMTLKGDADAPLHAVTRIELVPVEPRPREKQADDASARD